MPASTARFSGISFRPLRIAERNLYFSIAKTTDGNGGALVAAAPVHACVAVEQVAAVCARTIALGRTPKVGVEAKIAVTAVVVARGQRRKSSGVVA